MAKKFFEALLKIARIPDTNRGEWLENAQQSVDYLKDNLSSDEVLLYASGPHLLIQSVLTPNEVLDPPDHEDLGRAYIEPDQTWCIQKVYGGGEGHRIYLEPPLRHSGCKSLIGSEKLVFIRSFEGVDEYQTSIEINQKLVHALGLYYVDERSAYCRLDPRGDIENVITVYRDEPDDYFQKVRAVSIQARDLANYMALSASSLIALFDFTRFSIGGFSGWPEGKENIFMNGDLYYTSRKIPSHASYAHGHIVSRTKLTIEYLVDEWKKEESSEGREYASFIIIDRKNENRIVETSCSPNHIVNYFTDSNLPWEISPSFFRPEVLQKYKADPEKYTFGDRSISCRNSWHLKTYDINEAGQVHTYIYYLASLPYDEQLYWKSFNEAPKANISERAFQTDILGEYTTVDDHLEDLKNKIYELEKKSPKWWKPRGQEIRNAVRYPVTDSVSEWGDEILALDHFAVEGFVDRPLRSIITANSGSFEKEWRSLKLLEVALMATGRTPDQASDAVAPFRELHALRNPVKAHGNPKGRRLAVADARKKHDTLRGHFTDLCKRLASAFSVIVDTLPK